MSKKFKLEMLAFEAAHKLLVQKNKGELSKQRMRCFYIAYGFLNGKLYSDIVSKHKSVLYQEDKRIVKEILVNSTLPGVFSNTLRIEPYLLAALKDELPGGLRRKTLKQKMRILGRVAEQKYKWECWWREAALIDIECAEKHGRERYSDNEIKRLKERWKKQDEEFEEFQKEICPL